MRYRGTGRIYVGPVPERDYAHPGYRGTFELRGPWIFMRVYEVEWLQVDEETRTHQWQPIEVDQCIPASAVESIEWHERYAV